MAEKEAERPPAVSSGLDFTRHSKMFPQPRQKPMEVLCLGLSRTGTMSLYVALGKLGLKSYHAMEMGLDNANGSIKRWKAALESKYFSGKKAGKLETAADFDRLLWRYQATTDIPCALFADELLLAYPNAKVVLTTRDEDAWIRSVQNSFHTILSWRVWTLLQLIDWEYSRVYIPLLHYCLRIWTGNDENNIVKLRAGYRAHNAHIRSIVPEENLLEYHVSQGWEPLCNFLGKPVPDEPMPRINEGSFAVDLHKTLVRKRFWIVWEKFWRGVLVPGILTGAVGAAIGTILSGRRETATWGWVGGLGFGVVLSLVGIAKVD